MEEKFSITRKIDLLTIINFVAPSIEDINKEIEELRKSNPKLQNKELSKKFSSKVIKNYTNVGVASALPSVKVQLLEVDLTILQ